MRHLVYVGRPAPTLRLTGWRVTTAPSPWVARMKIANDPPNGVVCALDLGDREPFLSQLRATHPSVLRVVATPDGEPFSASLLSMAQGWVSLPISGPRLESTLDRMLGGDGILDLPEGLEGIRLPVLPESTQRILDVLDAEDASRSRVSATIEQEPTLAARVLALSNSAYYGLARRVSTIAEAIGSVGLDAIRSTVLACQAMAAFDLPSSLIKEVQAMSLFRTSLVRRMMGRPDEQLATAALLADVGALLLLTADPDYELAVAPTSNSLAEEAQRLGTDRGLLSATVLQSWNLPTEVAHLTAEAADTRIHPARARETGVLLRIATLLTAEAHGEPVVIDPAWIAAVGLESQMKRWRRDSATLAMQWPAA